MDINLQNISTIPQMPTQNKETMDKAHQAALKAAKKFEGFFVGFVFDQIHENMERSDLWGDTQAQQIFEGMFMQKVSEESSNGPKGGLGIARQLYEQFNKHLGNYTVNSNDSVQKGIGVSEKV